MKLTCPTPPRLPGRLTAGIMFVSLLAIGCGRHDQVGSPKEPSGDKADSSPLRLTDVTAESGLSFKHSHGGSGRHYYIETMGPGCAFFDYDNDGWLDVIVLQGAPLPDYEDPQELYPAVYRNNGDGTFSEVTDVVGLKQSFYGLGVAVGDYDNDGWADLYFTALQGNRLFHNEGGQRFVEVTETAGVRGQDMSTSAAWLDYDLDGDLDLFVGRYMDYDLDTNPRCRDHLGRATYCTPHAYPPVHSQLYRNNGNGTFTDVSEASGIAGAKSRAMGIACADFNQDGLIDIFVSSDLSANMLFVNQGDGTFKENALFSGVAYGEDGSARAGMGVDCGDYDNDGDMDIIITNFANETNSLFENAGDGTFFDKSVVTGVYQASKRYLGWGCKFVDFNLDGYAELFWVNGHVNDYEDEIEGSVGYSQSAQVLLNNRDGKFTDASGQAGDFFQKRQVGRGAAFGDYDNDGDLDVLVACNNQPSILLRNDSPRQNKWVQLKLVGQGCNRDALGSLVKIETTELTKIDFVRSGTSYLSDNDRRLSFGIGQAERVKVSIRWPCGARQEMEVQANASIQIVEESCDLRPKFTGIQSTTVKF